MPEKLKCFWVLQFFQKVFLKRNLLLCLAVIAMAEAIPSTAS
jgi:hypothetical protein